MCNNTTSKITQCNNFGLCFWNYRFDLCTVWNEKQRSCLVMTIWIKFASLLVWEYLDISIGLNQFGFIRLIKNANFWNYSFKASSVTSNLEKLFCHLNWSQTVWLSHENRAARSLVAHRLRTLLYSFDITGLSLALRLQTYKKNWVVWIGLKRVGCSTSPSSLILRYLTVYEGPIQTIKVQQNI